MWCIPSLTPEYIERMEDVLDLYARPYDARKPVVCIDEKSKELRKDARTAIPTKAGRVRRRDYEYVRNGTANIFMTVEPKGGYRTTRVTDHRAKRDFAEEMRRLLTLPRYRCAKKLYVVLDNLNTHGAHSLIERFGEKEAQHLMRRIEFHHTPKHASWLDMAEIELSIMERQCTRKRIADASTLAEELRAWQSRRNRTKATINWSFTKADARRKFNYGDKTK